MLHPIIIQIKNNKSLHKKYFQSERTSNYELTTERKYFYKKTNNKLLSFQSIQRIICGKVT